MITINDNLIYRNYKQESALDGNYLYNEGMKEAIKLIYSKAESVADNKDATINISGDLNAMDGQENIRFDIICNDIELQNRILKAIS
jgi:hypothetical protein